MKLYEIDSAIASLVDENGEILDFDAFANLQMEREKKIEGMALWYKNLTSDAAQIKAEEQALAERRNAMENAAARLKSHITFALAGQKFETARVKCGYRKSTAVIVTDAFMEWAKASAPGLLTIKEPEPNKTAIREAIDAGADVTGAYIEEKQNIQIK